MAYFYWLACLFPLSRKFWNHNWLCRLCTVVENTPSGALYIYVYISDTLTTFSYVFVVEIIKQFNQIYDEKYYVNQYHLYAVFGWCLRLYSQTLRQQLLLCSCSITGATNVSCYYCYFTINCYFTISCCFTIFMHVVLFCSCQIPVETLLAPMVALA